MLFCDDSVRFIANSVSSWPFDNSTGVIPVPAGAVFNTGGWWDHLPQPGVWQSLSTRSGGEIINADGY